MPEEGLDDLAAISFGGTSQSQVLAERGWPRTPFFAELANLASGMQTKQRDW